MPFLIKVITICKLVKVLHGFSQVGTPTIGLFFQQFKTWAELHYSNLLRSKTWQVTFFRMWIWCGKMGLSMEAKTRWQLKLHTSPHACVSKFLQGEQRDMHIVVEWNISKNLSLQQDVKKSIIKNHLGHT